MDLPGHPGVCGAIHPHQAETRQEAGHGPVVVKRLWVVLAFFKNLRFSSERLRMKKILECVSYETALVLNLIMVVENDS